MFYKIETLKFFSRNSSFIKEFLQVYNKYFTTFSYENTVTIAPVLLHPKSSGELRLQSIDPFDDPLIDPKYLSNIDDIDTIIEGN